jgi:uncharacterized phage-like protein YoqJ
MHGPEYCQKKKFTSYQSHQEQFLERMKWKYDRSLNQVAHTHNLSTQEAEAERLQFKASLVYIVTQTKTALVKVTN